MAQNQRRMVYLKIWASEQFSRLSDKAKLLYIGTITLADDDGRLIAKPSYLRGQLFPFEDELSVSEVLRLRNEIEKTLLFSTYSINNCEYIQHPKWTEYQVIRKDLYKKSALPFRNETVTKPLRKSVTSKDKISKDNTTAKADTKMDIDYETGEEINKPIKSHKREDVIKLSLMFDKMASEYAKIKIITPRSYFIVLNAINTHGLKPKGIIKLFIDWFENEKTKPEDKVKLSWALGKDNINNFKMLNK